MCSSDLGGGGEGGGGVGGGGGEYRVVEGPGEGDWRQEKGEVLNDLHKHI